MALDTPVLEDPYSKKAIEQIILVISAAFLIECVLKIFVLGFIGGRYAYLKDPFNGLDFVIVCISVLSFVLESTNKGDLNFMKAFRALRALRPLKLVSKNEGMKNVINSLLSSIPALINVQLISMLFYFTFSTIGVQVLMGRTGYCTDDQFKTKKTCVAAGHQWEFPNGNYNNIIDSMIVFQEISTLENWTAYLYDAIYAGPVDSAKSEEMNFYLFILFAVFIFITSFFILNLFISVIVSKFSEQKMKMEGMADLNDEQKEWVKI